MKDIVRERLGAAESANAMKDKKIDAFFFVAGLPTAAITDLAATPGTKIKMIDTAHLAPKMVQKYGEIYSATVIPKATYPGMDADNPNVAVWNIMAVNGKMSDDLAYNLTKLMMESREDLGQAHAEGKNIREQNQTKVKAGVPFHPGALKYFAEKGIKVQ
jgi:TRAP transporter TAXI family solute receptor